MTDTELRRLAENATRGMEPWTYRNQSVYATNTLWLAALDPQGVISDASVDAVGAYIAATSPDVVIGLLDRIKALEVERDAALRRARSAEDCDGDRDGVGCCGRCVTCLRAERDALRVRLRAHAAKGGE